MNSDVLVRLNALEQANRRLRRWIIYLGIMLASLLASSLVGPTSPDVEAQRFVVRDAAGRIRAVLGMQQPLRGESREPRPALRIYDEDGTARAFLGADKPVMWNPAIGESQRVGGQLVLSEDQGVQTELSSRGVFIRDQGQSAESRLSAESFVASGDCLPGSDGTKPWERDRVEVRLALDPFLAGATTSARAAKLEIDHVPGAKKEQSQLGGSLVSIGVSGNRKVAEKSASGPATPMTDSDITYSSQAVCQSVRLSNRLDPDTFTLISSESGLWYHRTDQYSQTTSISTSGVSVQRLVGPYDFKKRRDPAIDVGFADDGISPRIVLRDNEGTDRAILGTSTIRYTRTGDLRTTSPASLVLFDAKGKVEAKLPPD